MTDDHDPADAAPDLTDPHALALAVLHLHAAGRADAADALLHEATGGTVGKSMSTLSLSDGGALVPPAGCVPARRRRKKLRKKLDALVKALPGE